MLKHTPGPWGLTHYNGWPAVGSDTESGCLIAEMDRESRAEYSFEVATANARLMAAAPDLLDAVRQFMDYAHALKMPDWHFLVSVERLLKQVQK